GVEGFGGWPLGQAGRFSLAGRGVWDRPTGGFKSWVAIKSWVDLDSYASRSSRPLEAPMIRTAAAAPAAALALVVALAAPAAAVERPAAYVDGEGAIVLAEGVDAGVCRTFHGAITITQCVPLQSPAGAPVETVWEDGSAEYADGAVYDPEDLAFRLSATRPPKRRSPHGHHRRDRFLYARALRACVHVRAHDTDDQLADDSSSTTFGFRARRPEP